MNSLKTLVGNCVFLDGVKKSRITFSEETGLIDSVDTQNIVPSKTDHYIYNEDCLIFPGMGDIHIHAREDVSLKNTYKEDFKSACCASLNGGVVHVGDMPNNPVPPVDDHSYSQKVELSKNIDIPLLMYAGIGPKTNPISFKVPYKAFMGPSIGDLFFKTNDELEAAIVRYQNQWVSFHCEDPKVLEDSKNATDHFKRRPVVAENLATDFALYLIEKYHLKGKLCHYSSGAGLDAILAAKKRGVPVQIEVTPQHLFFSEESILKKHADKVTYFQMNPPIRTEVDRQKMLSALKNGDIDFLATDHAPHSKEEKEKGMSGMPGLDTYSLFVTWLLNENKLDPSLVLKFVSINPGNFINEFLPELQKLFPHYRKFGLGFGHFKPNFSASFTVLNLNKPTLFKSELMKSKAHWSPFEQFQFSGGLEAVFLNGILK